VIPLWHRLAASCALAIRRHRGRFPEDMTGACITASVLLGLVYRAHRIPFRYVHGHVPGRGPHALVETRGQRVDITATQFGIDQLVYPGCLANVRRFPTFAKVGKFYQGQSCWDVWHTSNPRRNFATLVPALAEVLGLSRAEARRRVTAYLGPAAR